MVITISETEEVKGGMLDDDGDFHVWEIRNEAPDAYNQNASRTTKKRYQPIFWNPKHLYLVIVSQLKRELDKYGPIFSRCNPFESFSSCARVLILKLY